MIKAVFECNCCGDVFNVVEDVNSLNEIEAPSCSSDCSGGCKLKDVYFVAGDKEG